MATLCKVTYSKPIPAGAKIVERDGERFAKLRHKGKMVEAPLTADGRKVRIEAPEWYVSYKDTDGRWKREKAYTDARASEALKAKIQERIDRELAGVSPFKKHYQTPLSEHLDDWRASMNIQPRGSEAEASRQHGRVKRVFDACGFARLADLQDGESEVEAYLGPANQLLA